ncbi:uncharacterized protein E1O_12510 [Burkholderiales bacterium GJ-E10]|nr:uncharacterized protein E1O_12510 [Burkholderiales bacterium GJ-E10]
MSTEKEKNAALDAEVYHRIADVPPEHWDGLAARGSVGLSRAFWSIMEASRINDFDFRYVLFYDAQRRPVALAGFYSVTTDIAIFAPGPLRAALGAVRRVLPNFFKLRMIECGTPITITSPPFVYDPAIDPEAVVDALDRVLRRTARAEGQFLIVVRDFEPDAAALQSAFGRRGYHGTDSLPNTYLALPWSTPEEYLAALRSYYRSKLVKHRKRNAAAGVTHTVIDDFADLADELCAEWMVVHESASEFQREVLTPDFYRRLSRDLGPLSKAILFHRHGERVGHALLLRDGDMLRWLYVGRKVSGNDGLYLYVAQTVVLTAIELGVRRLEMGLTTYAIKQDLGAEVVPIRLALRANRSWINPFVGLGYKLLNRVPAPAPRAVFK